MIGIDNDSIQPVRIRLNPSTQTQSNPSATINVPIGGSQPGYNADEFLRQIQKKEREQNALELDKKDPEYIIKAMTECSPAIIKASGFKTSDGKDIFVAESECKNGEIVEHYFALVDKKFVEYEKKDKSLSRTSTTIKPSKLQEAVENAGKAKEESETAGNAYQEFLEGNMSGGKVFEKINGATEDRYYNKINKSLKNLNKDNIVGFLSSYYEKSKYNGDMEEKDGLLEWLDEEYDGGVIGMDGKKNAVNALLEKAKELGLDKCEEYLDIKEMMSDYSKDGAFEDVDNFRGSSWKGSKGRNFAIGVGDTAAGAATGAVVGGIVGTAVAVVGGLFSGGVTWAAVGPAAGCGAKIGAWVGTGVSCLLHHTQVIWRWGKAGKRTDSGYLDEAMFNLHKKILEKIGG